VRERGNYIHNNLCATVTVLNVSDVHNVQQSILTIADEQNSVAIIMSEPAPAPEVSELSAESTMGDDATIPTAEILNALEQLKESQQTEKQESQEQALDPPSEWDLLRQQLKDKPHDPVGWRKLVEMAENSGEIDKINDAYESLLATYPNTVRANRCSLFPLMIYVFAFLVCRTNRVCRTQSESRFL
jgi:hypothetical protein